MVFVEVKKDIEGTKVWVISKNTLASEVKWIISIIVLEAIFEVVPQSFAYLSNDYHILLRWAKGRRV